MSLQTKVGRDIGMPSMHVCVHPSVWIFPPLSAKVITQCTSKLVSILGESWEMIWFLAVPAQLYPSSGNKTTGWIASTGSLYYKIIRCLSTFGNSQLKFSWTISLSETFIIRRAPTFGSECWRLLTSINFDMVMSRSSGVRFWLTVAYKTNDTSSVSAIWEKCYIDTCSDPWYLKDFARCHNEIYLE